MHLPITAVTAVVLPFPTELSQGSVTLQRQMWQAENALKVHSPGIRPHFHSQAQEAALLWPLGPNISITGPPPWLFAPYSRSRPAHPSLLCP